MNIIISRTSEELGQKAGALAKQKIQEALTTKGSARLLLATGMSQMETIRVLVESNIDWSKVEVFHMDEYIGLPSDHKASFVKYIKERFVDKVNVGFFHPVETRGDISENIKKLSAVIKESPIDVAMIGIGENTHIGFNDPPADFETKEAYITVKLDDRCKKQQVGEGWFPSLDDGPDIAVTITPHQILQCRTIICSVPFAIKAEAVYKTITSKTDPNVPASILKRHHEFYLFVDRDSASRVVQF